MFVAINLSSIAAACSICKHCKRRHLALRPHRCRALPAKLAVKVLNPTPHSIASRCGADNSRWYAKCCRLGGIVSASRHLSDNPASLSETENWLALGTGALLLIVGASRRSAYGACLAVASGTLLYRGITGRWPAFLDNHVQADDTKAALGGERGVHVREAVRVERPVAEVWRFWRRLEQLPRFMTHLDRVTETSDGKSHWVAAGPAGLTVEWDAEIINEVENHILAWRSLPGSDVVTAGSVTFDAVRGGRSTQIQREPAVHATGRESRRLHRVAVWPRAFSDYSARISGTSSSCSKPARFLERQRQRRSFDASRLLGRQRKDSG